MEPGMCSRDARECYMNITKGELDQYIQMWKDGQDTYSEEASCENSMFSIFVIRNHMHVQIRKRKMKGHEWSPFEKRMEGWENTFHFS